MKDIIELAKQAGLYLDNENTQQPLYVLSPDELTRFAHLVRTAALAEQQQEPVAWCHLQYNKDGTYFADCLQHYQDSYGNTPLYVSPQPRREPLTDQEILEMAHDYGDLAWQYENTIGFVRTVERAHNITGETK